MNTAAVTFLSTTPSSAADRIPAANRRWLTRVGLPAAIVVIAAVLFAIASREVWMPATEVSIVRTVARTGQGGAAGTTVEARGSAGQSSPLIVAQAPGWIEPDPFPIRVPALTEGTLEEVLVLEGDSVAIGQIVARMIDAEAKITVRRAQAEVDQRQAMLDAAQAQWDHPVARVRAVAVGKAMVEETQLEESEVQAMALVESAKLAELEGHLNRVEQLPEGILEQDRVERTRFQVEAQRAAVGVLAARRSVVKAKRNRYEAELVAAERDMELRIAEKQSLAEAKAMLEEARAALAEAQLRESRMEIRSPAAGVVMQRFAAPGVRMMLSGDQPEAGYVAALYDPAKLQVRADVPLGDAAKIGVGQRAQVIVDVLPDRVFTGTVTRLVHQADIGKNTIQVKVAVDDPVPQLKPEMLARVKFLALPHKDGAARESANGPMHTSELSIFVPEHVVQRDGSGTTVWTIDAKTSTARRKSISLGAITQDGWIETVAGLNPGDAVIVDPKALSEGDRVRVIGEIDDVSKQ